MMRGFVSGVLGVIGMAGVSFPMRRMVEPNKPIGTTHYEKVVEKSRSTFQPDAEPLDKETQIRIGEVGHLAFGGYMPLLGISRGIKDMDAYEASRTWLCHITYASVMALLLKEMRHDQLR